MKVMKPILELTAEDVMSRAVVTIPREAPMREAARLLRRANVSGGAVVDDQGRCVGVLSAYDFLRWAEGEGRAADGALAALVCPYLTRAGAGEQGHWICGLAPGNCPLQTTRPTTGGRLVSLCLRPGITPAEWDRLVRSCPDDPVMRHATADVVTAVPQTPLAKLARTMIDAGIHRVFVTDQSGRPVGVVSSTDLLAALAAEGARQEWSAQHEASPHEEAQVVAAGAG